MPSGWQGLNRIRKPESTQIRPRNHSITELLCVADVSLSGLSMHVYAFSPTSTRVHSRRWRAQTKRQCAASQYSNERNL
ncbi:unnamed protein product [Anisakis simplex]|uniref:Uncharacterized protein n=1 Tax=Anisakis simplex TaxID=6269 RepID=A0A3P6P6K4_ANISI|nr:unnamed protein product [Anisakis simplex]